MKYILTILITIIYTSSFGQVIKGTLGGKLNVSDTSAMLSPYLQKIDTTNKWVSKTVADATYAVIDNLAATGIVTITSTVNSRKITLNSGTAKVDFGDNTNAALFATFGAYDNFWNFQANSRPLNFRSDTRTSIIYSNNVTGFVGINNTTPTAMLDVVGDAKFSGNVLTYGSLLSKIAVKSSDPTTTDIPDGFTAVYRNSTSGNTYLWANVGGTLLKIQLQ